MSIIHAPHWDSDLCLKAARFGAKAHATQTMLGTSMPYLLHVASVAFETAQAVVQDGSKLTGDLAIPCAWLHDTVEDTETTPDILEAHFGPSITAGVMALTKNASMSKTEAMLDSISRLKQQSSSVRAIKLADRIVNLEPPPANWSTKKRSRYADEADLILNELGDSSAWLSSRLTNAIARYRAEHIPS